MSSLPLSTEENHDSETIGPFPALAFAQGTGVVLQVVGGAFLMVCCCMCSTAFQWDPQWTLLEAESIEPAPPRGRLADLVADPGKFGLMATVVASTVGGLGLLGFGLGLQTDKPRAAWGAVICVCILLIAMLVAAYGLWWGSASWPARVVNGLMVLVVLVLLPFTVTALRQVRANPPSGALNLVPYDYDPKKDLGHH